MSYQEEVLADMPLVYLRLGEASGTVAEDSSGNGNDGTYVNAPTLGQTGAIQQSSDKAVSFNGLDERVSLTRTFFNTFAVATKRSVEFWIKTSSTSDGHVFGTSNDGSTTIFQLRLNAIHSGTTSVGSTSYTLRDESGNFIRMSWEDSDVDIYDGEWHHVVIVEEGSNTYKIYVDGVSVTLGSTTSGTYSNPGVWDYDLLLAVFNNKGTPAIFGAIELDEFACYGSALSAERVRAHYAAGLSVYSEQIILDDPVAYWPLTDPSGSVAKDIGKNQYHGTYINSPTLGQTSLLPSGEGTSVKFDAASEQSVKLPTISELPGASKFTVELWGKMTDPGTNRAWYFALTSNTAGAGEIFQLQNTGSANGDIVRLRVDNDDSNVLLDDDEPEHYEDTTRHIVCRFDGDAGVVELVVDGVVRVTGELSGVLDSQPSPTNTLAANSVSGTVQQWMSGFLGHVAFYDSYLSDERIAAHRTAAVGNTQPDTPTVTVDEVRPNSGQVDLSLVFSDDDGDSQAATQWQVDLASGDFSDPIFDSGEDTTNLLSITVTDLDVNEEFQARARVKDDSGDTETEWSEYSTAVEFDTKVWSNCGVAEPATATEYLGDESDEDSPEEPIAGVGNLSLVSTGLIFTDTFNRADANPVDGGWSSSSMELVSNRLNMTSGGSVPTYTMREASYTPDDDQGVITEGHFVGVSNNHECALGIAREDPSDSGLPAVGYRGHMDHNNDENLHIYRGSSTVIGTLASDFSVIARNTAVRLRMSVYQYTVRFYITNESQEQTLEVDDEEDGGDVELGTWWGPDHMNSQGHWDNLMACGTHIRVRNMPSGWKARITMQDDSTETVTEVDKVAVFDVRDWVLPAVKIEILDSSDVVVDEMTPDFEDDDVWPGGIWGGDLYELEGVGGAFDDAEEPTSTSWSEV